MSVSLGWFLVGFSCGGLVMLVITHFMPAAPANWPRR